MDNLKHIPVMINECIDGLKLKEDGIYFDGTLGGAGHSYEILSRGNNTKLYATDLDEETIVRANERLKSFSGRYKIINDNFKNFKEIMKDNNIEGFDGILLDFGISSFQIDDKSRGFSYLAKDFALDMRMDKGQALSAKTVVNEYAEEDIRRILTEYGEEKFAKNIAKNIVESRSVKVIETCGELVEIISKSIPMKFQRDGHPAKRTFQAIRIEVNGELDDLYETVLSMGRSLNKGGRLVILTFHSLEDRVVKNAYKYLECDCVCDKRIPICICDKEKEVEIITKHPIIASGDELEMNTRSKSAKLRILEKI